MIVADYEHDDGGDDYDVNNDEMVTKIRMIIGDEGDESYEGDEGDESYEGDEGDKGDESEDETP